MISKYKWECGNRCSIEGKENCKLSGKVIEPIYKPETINTTHCPWGKQGRWVEIKE